MRGLAFGLTRHKQAAPGRRNLFLSLALVLFSTLSLLLAGCGDAATAIPASSTTAAATAPGAASPVAATAASGQQKTYRVAIDIPFHPFFNYLSAMKDTYFKDKPYKVEMRVLDAQTQPTAFAKGDIDVMTTPASLIPLLEKQYNIKTQYFWPMARWTVGAQILVPTSSAYTKVEDLKGKKVSIQPLKTRWGSEQVAILARTSTKIEDYFKLVETEQAAQELELGRSDAAFIEAPLTVPLLQSGKFKAIFSIADGFKDRFKTSVPVLSGGYIAKSDFIKQNPEFVNDWIKANQDVWTKYQKDPKSVIDVAAKQSGIPTEQLDVVAQVIGLKDITPDQQAVVDDDVKIYTDFYALLNQTGFSEQVPTDIPGIFLLTKNIKK